LGRIAKRQIQVAWIERAVQQPDVVEDDEFDAELEHRLGKVPELANRVLRPGYRYKDRSDAGSYPAFGRANERQNMKLTIDKEADALYLDLDETPAVESEEISMGVILDYNGEGKVTGIEPKSLPRRTR
ncbi:MAG: DUF2283 domain-containing protein, partial [Chthoniobacterales bacterium]